MDSQPQKKFKVLVIGDTCLDIYRYGTVDRLSPEAPVPIFQVSHEEQRHGMAANVRANLERLGCAVGIITGNTSVKTRLIDQRSKQHIVRIDSDAESEPAVIFNEIFEEYDAVVVSDYNKGTVTYEVLEQIRTNFSGPVFVDTKKTDLARLDGLVVKINAFEYSRIVSSCTDLIVTQGGDGAVYYLDDTEHRYPGQAVEVSDVTGAGDTFLAALTYQYLVTNRMKSAIEFAIRASAVTVQHFGVYAPTLEEIR
jgi:D-beta-D-heptose 7-phosphate kinase/D-beta-D-heptose 1-phosphate adenosyltransferase